MAEKVLDLTAIQTLKTWIAGKFATKDYVDENGGKIDVIKVNGDEQTIVNKEVDLSIPESTFGVNAEYNDGSYQTMTRAGDSFMVNFHDQVDTIQIEVIDATSGDTAMTEAPTMSFIQGADYQSAEQVQAMIDAELADITGIDFQVVQALPATGVKGTIYLVPKGSELEPPYNEFIWVEPEAGTAHYEQIGDTQIDLTGYWSKEEMTIATVEEINAILNA